MFTPGIQLPKTDDNGLVLTVPLPMDGSKVNFMSVNWCDKCSWYEGSLQVVNETLVDSGDGLTFTSAHTKWIDMKHGRVTFEDMVLAANPGKWVAEVTSDNVAKTESPAGTTSGDFQINYSAGTVTFNSSQAGKTIKASYWYGNTGTFTVKPAANKKLTLLRVEIQFSADIVLTDTMTFTPYGYAGVFAPSLVPSVFAADDVIPLMAVPYKYKTFRDYVNESNGTYPVIPAFGGPNWRGGTQNIVTLPWSYLSKTEVLSSAGMEIRINMENNSEMGGELATATFYTIESDE